MATFLGIPLSDDERVLCEQVVEALHELSGHLTRAVAQLRETNRRIGEKVLKMQPPTIPAPSLEGTLQDTKQLAIEARKVRVTGLAVALTALNSRGAWGVLRYCLELQKYSWIETEEYLEDALAAIRHHLKR